MRRRLKNRTYMKGRIKTAYWIGLAVIAVSYAIFYVYFRYSAFYTMPARQIRVVKFIFVALTFAAGWLGLRKGAVEWAARFWALIFGSLVLLLVLLGLYENYFARLPKESRVLLEDLVEFLVSPALYVVLGILGRISEKA
jgi:hypothetical protein